MEYELIGEHSPESNNAALSVPELHARCTAEITDIISGIASNLTEGKDTGYDSDHVSIVLSDSAERAADSGNLTSAEKSLDLLAKLPNPSEYLIARTCYSLITQGSERAFTLLRSKLSSERTKNIAKLEEETAKYPFPAIANVTYSPILQMTIEMCARNNSSPEQWINEYAANRYHAWELNVDYYGKLLKMNPEADDLHMLCDRKAAEILDLDVFEPVHLLYEGPRLLSMVRDPNIKQQLFYTLLENLDKVPLTYPVLLRFAHFAIAMSNDEAVGEPEVMDALEEILQECADGLEEAGVDSFTLTRDMTQWQLALAKYRGASMQEMVALLDARTSKLLSEDIPESGHGFDLRSMFRNKDYLTYSRDNILGSMAQQAAKDQDFASAKLALDAMSSEVSQEYAIGAVLKSATCEAHITTVKPDPLTLDVYPELLTEFTAAETLMVGDPASMTTYVLELVQTIARSNEHERMDSIKALFEKATATDEMAKVQLAEQIIAMLREKEVSELTLSYFSDILLNAGVPEEPARRYEDIDKRTFNSSWRLRRLYDLNVQLESLVA